MTLPLLFQFGKRNEKVMPPPVRIIFYIQPPLSLVVIFSSPLPLIFQSLHPPPGNYCTVS